MDHGIHLFKIPLFVVHLDWQWARGADTKLCGMVLPSVYTLANLQMGNSPNKASQSNQKKVGYSLSVSISLNEKPASVQPKIEFQIIGNN